MMNPPNLFTDSIFEEYRLRAHRGIFIDKHNLTFRFFPADYTDKCSLKDRNIPRLEVYQSIVDAFKEAKSKGITLHDLPLGKNTHNIKFHVEKVGILPVNTGRILVKLDLTNPGILLDSFNKLIHKYQTSEFIIGRIPFVNNLFYDGVQNFILNQNKIARIVHIKYQKQYIGTMHPRIAITSAMTPLVFGINPPTELDLDLSDSVEIIDPIKQKVEIDL